MEGWNRYHHRLVRYSTSRSQVVSYCDSDGVGPPSNNTQPVTAPGFIHTGHYFALRNTKFKMPEISIHTIMDAAVQDLMTRNETIKGAEDRSLSFLDSNLRPRV